MTRTLGGVAACVVMLPAGVAAKGQTMSDARRTLSPPWPQRPQVRVDLNFNRGWRFWRPSAPAPLAPRAVFHPKPDELASTGEMAATSLPQDFALTPRTSRFICLEAVSSHPGTPFACVAELWLLDETGKPLPRTGWAVAYADSEEPAADNLASYAIDGNPATMWHTQYNGAQPGMPHLLVVDLGKPTRYAGFRVQSRQDGNHSGMIRQWRFYAANTGPKVPKTAPEPELSRLNDAVWETVNLPHSVRLEPAHLPGGRNYQGVCWYRKRFPLARAWKGKVLYLNFGGAMQVADLWLNGKNLATHHGGYQPFVVDITRAARFDGENVLTVRLDNRDNPEVPPGKPERSLDFAYFGGLYREVRLQVMDPVHVTDPILANRVAGGGVFIRPKAATAERAVMALQVDVANEAAHDREVTIRLELTGPYGERVPVPGEAAVRVGAGKEARIVREIPIAAPKLWHPYHPYLYVLHTVLSCEGRVVDDAFTRFGVRTFRLDKDKGLFINGERFVTIGFNRHQDHPIVGYALPPSAHYADAKKMRDAGMTSYRSHYPQDPAFMDACDELGILSIVSNPGWQFMGGTLFQQRVYQDAREMIRRDRNHPSVVLWEAQLNETDNRPVAPTLQKIVHEEYPGEYCYSAGDRTVEEGFDSWDVDYSGNDGSKPVWTREWGDQVDNWGDQQSSSRVPRFFGETPMLVQAWAHFDRMNGQYAQAGGPEGKGRSAGGDLWAGIDCYRGYHYQPFYGGALDLFRLPKFDYYMFQSQRPVDVRVPGVDGGPMVYIANFGTFHSPSTVTVFTNCEEVRLSKGGKVVDTLRPPAGFQAPHPPITFQVGRIGGEQSMLFSTGVSQPGTSVGELKAEGLIGGKVVAVYEIRQPGVPTQLVLEADLTAGPLVADGSDWIRVYARICDARGTTYPYTDEPVAFSVEGPAEAIGDVGIGANPALAEAGIATVLVRSKGTAGSITVKASAPGLRAAALQLQAVPSRDRFWPAR